MTGKTRLLAVFILIGTATLVSRAEDPCRSGLQPGQRPGPYAFVLSTGLERGRSHCYVCETADRPAVAVFARQPSASLGKFAQELDKALAEHEKAELRSWITFLHEDQLNFDPKLVAWSQKLALRRLPVGTYEDTVGPPSYRLARDAEVTVILFVKQKVVANFAFRTGELNDDQVAKVVQALLEIVSAKKGQK
jgi:hypothetical protein